MTAATERLTARPARARVRPRTAQAIRIWLLCVAAAIVVTLAIGGATRITDSGLSITEWKPVVGVIPPLSHAQWVAEMKKYEQIPQYQLVYKGMTLEQFQGIYWWEWGHRLSARLIGFVVLLPMLFFWVRGALPRWLKGRLLLLLALGGLQGVVGWWMVYSGLSQRIEVSQYRLAIHLCLACALLALTVWTAYEAGPRPAALRPASPGTRRWSAIIVALIFGQLALGALVAGLRAGLASNTWPLMNGALIPDGLLTVTPWWLNPFTNPLTAQFDHRMLGYALFAVVLWSAFRAWRNDRGTGHARRAVVLAGLVLLQVAIGITLIVFEVPPSKASAHQVLAALILGFAVRHAWFCRAARREPRLDAVPAAGLAEPA